MGRYGRRVRTLTVTGHGSASAVPDAAVLRVAASRRANGAAEAFGAAAEAAATVAAVARRHTDAHHVATTGVHLWPWHDQQGEPRGFEARHALAVRCPGIDAAGPLLDDLLAEVGDALQLEGVSLVVSDPAAARAAATEAAYADARGRATRLAALSGAALGAVQHVAEGSAPAAVVGGGARVAAEATVALEPGESVVAADVTVTFELL